MYKVGRVSRRMCAGYAKQLGLGPCIRMVPGFRRHDGAPGPEDSMLAESFEAILGAMYKVRFWFLVQQFTGLLALHAVPGSEDPMPEGAWCHLQI